jgi:hypothetical protein
VAYSYLQNLLGIGSHLHRRPHVIWWQLELEQELESEGLRKRFSTVFGSSKVDLTHAPNDGGDVHIDTVFGETRVMIDPKQALRIRANAVFGEARMPNDDMVAFGTLNYKSPSSETTPTKLKIHANVVFGSIRFESASEPTPNASASPSKKDDDSED